MQPRNMFRRITALALAFTMLLSAGLAASDDLSYPFTTVTTDNVNMRRSASSSSVVLERIDKGDSITVLGTSGNYYKVSYNDRTGYVLKQYVDVSAATTLLPTVAVVETATGHPYETTTKDSGEPAGKEIHLLGADPSDSPGRDDYHPGRVGRLRSGGV